MLTGKIITTNKNLESHNIPDRFYKRMAVWIFKTIDKRKIPMKLAVKFCTCHDEFYYCGDCEDDVMPYWIPVEWVKINDMEFKNINFKMEDINGKRYGMFCWENPENQKWCLSRAFEYPYWAYDEGLKDIRDIELEAFKRGLDKQLNTIKLNKDEQKT